MGVPAPVGVTHAYYFAYPIGLFVAFFTYWGACVYSPPPIRFPLNEWHEVTDYLREEDQGVMLKSEELEISRGSSGSIVDKEKGSSKGNVVVTGVPLDI